MRKPWKTSHLARFATRLLREESGQALVEYILGLSTAVALVSILGIGFRRSIMSIWQMISKEVTAACPGCPPDPSIQFR